MKNSGEGPKGVGMGPLPTVHVPGTSPRAPQWKEKLPKPGPEECPRRRPWRGRFLEAHGSVPHGQWCGPLWGRPLYQARDGPSVLISHGLYFLYLMVL